MKGSKCGISILSIFATVFLYLPIHVVLRYWVPRNILLCESLMKTNELGQYPHREGLPYKKDVLLITEETQPLFYPLKGMTSTLSILFGSPLLGQSTSSQLDPAWPHADCIFTLSGIYNTVYIHQCWYEISDIILKNKFGRLHYYLLNPKNIIGKLKIKLRQFDHKNT